MSLINKQSRNSKYSNIKQQESLSKKRKREETKHTKVQVIKQQKPENTHRSENKKYDEESLFYVNELFDQKIQKIIRAISRQAYNREQISFIKKYPISKIFTFFAKKLFFNAMELMFLQYILEQNKWTINDETINKNYHNIKDFMNNTDVADQKEYKCLLLYLALISYSAKYCLNESMELFQFEFNNMIDDFQSHFKQWSKRNSTVNYKVSPKVLNNIFRRLNSKQQRENYFMIVQSIIDISPPYNNNAEKKKQKKKEKPREAAIAVEKSEYAQYKNLQQKQLPEIPALNYEISLNYEYRNMNMNYDDDNLPQLLLQRQATSINQGIENIIDKSLMQGE